MVWVNKIGAVGFSNPSKLKQLTDFIVEVDVRKLSDAPGAQQSVFFRSDEKNQYSLTVTDTGNFAVSKLWQGNTSKLKDWTPSTSIKTGKETNKLRIVCQGKQFEFYANGNKLATVTDDALTSGSIILTIGAGDPAGARYGFDNFRLYSPN